MKIFHKNTVLGINLSLAMDQHLDFDTFCAIVALHKERYDLNQIFDKLTDPILIRMVFVQLREIEFELQYLWGFPSNEIYHRSFYWSHCKCPKMDNADAFPLMQYKSGNCPLHGPDIR
jgi:hypothetical protein